ncbi:hypothetical protein [Escherichia coli]|uniref:hypothetical protein n=1 Tax=Escherichia coli TaxID=562 RepID=UPI0028794BA8|nr:hypothetical protein [Escherichia coli]MDS1617156.1 hypothetical protein [Escherichia coli]
MIKAKKQTVPQNVKKFVSARGRPMICIPGNYPDYCDRYKLPLLVVWRRTVYADVTWLNEPFQISHRELWEQENFTRDIENGAEEIFWRYAANNPKAAQAITASFITLYDLTISNAEKAACDLFDMTLALIDKYTTRNAKEVL